MAHPHAELAAKLQTESARANALAMAHRDHGWQSHIGLALYHQRVAADRSSLARQLMGIE